MPKVEGVAAPLEPTECRSCNSQMKDVRLCLVCYTAHQLDLPSNRGHAKIECTNPWHGGAISHNSRNFLLTKRGYSGQEVIVTSLDKLCADLDDYAAAVSKNLQQELATQTRDSYYEAFKLEHTARKAAESRILELEKEITALREKPL